MHCGQISLMRRRSLLELIPCLGSPSHGSCRIGYGPKINVNTKHANKERSERNGEQIRKGTFVFESGNGRPTEMSDLNTILVCLILTY